MLSSVALPWRASWMQSPALVAPGTLTVLPLSEYASCLQSTLMAPLIWRSMCEESSIVTLALMSSPRMSFSPWYVPLGASKPTTSDDEGGGVTPEHWLKVASHLFFFTQETHAGVALPRAHCNAQCSFVQRATSPMQSAHALPYPPFCCMQVDTQSFAPKHFFPHVAMSFVKFGDSFFHAAWSASSMQAPAPPAITNGVTVAGAVITCTQNILSPFFAVAVTVVVVFIMLEGRLLPRVKSTFGMPLTFPFL